jgi:hypothetical protein
MGFLTGIVEGFYGQQWSWSDRHYCARWLADRGHNTYLYCPKGDLHLRRQWQRDWPRGQRAALEKLAGDCAGLGLQFGVGLSPFALYQQYAPPQRRTLQRRVAELAPLGGLLAILFDDMPGECENLALRQAEIVADVASWYDGELLVCPTYYSFDAQLETYFGAMPEDYWQELGQALPPEVRVFWTGNEVCSRQISVADIRRIADQLGRPPLLWDNYPVNDGSRACNYLHLRPLSDRDPGLSAVLTGHLCNPMNQARLSLHALSGLATLYGGAPRTLAADYDEGLCQLLNRDGERFQSAGLAALDPSARRELAKEYAACADPAAQEVVRWLNDEYAFDPACLTD